MEITKKEYYIQHTGTGRFYGILSDGSVGFLPTGEILGRISMTMTKKEFELRQSSLFFRCTLVEVHENSDIYRNAIEGHVIDEPLESNEESQRKLLSSLLKDVRQEYAHLKVGIRVLTESRQELKEQMEDLENEQIAKERRLEEVLQFTEELENLKDSFFGGDDKDEDN